MELSYVVEKSEQGAVLRSITRAVWSRKENRKRKYTLQFLNVALWIPIGAFISYSYKAGDDFGKWAIYGVALGVSVVLIYKFAERRVLNNMTAESGLSFGETRFSADQNGVTIDTRNNTSTTKWSGIKDITLSGEYVLLFIASSAAIFVPKREVQDVQSFIQDLESLRVKGNT